MKHTVLFIVYAKSPPKRFSGILGEIDLYKIQFLLAGGKQLIQESYDGQDPATWYTKVLEEQDIIIAASKTQKIKGHTLVWLEVDAEKTPIHEFTIWTDLPANDNETLAWRPFYYSCTTQSGSEPVKECLGLAVKARETVLFPGKQPILLNTVLDAILGA